MKNTIIILLGLIIWVTGMVSCTGDDDDDISNNVTIPENAFQDPRDGNIYKTVQIGNQIWMAENLRYMPSSGGYYYNDKAENGKKYGVLYTWKAAKKAVPEGWHLPTEEEWQQLEQFLGIPEEELNQTGYRGTNEADKLKPGGETGFNLQYGGIRISSGMYSSLGTTGEYWTATSSLEGFKAWSREFRKDNPKIYREDNVIDNALSVRCVKD